ncbi:hypothetical protein SDC9_155098 [bioreactor metagenome]|uniref:Uncharacterized protein n=1 Tax=bioreactor metagenome TaxID=1076179 RepID=A0A645F2G1_9ZZZZ
MERGLHGIVDALQDGIVDGDSLENCRMVADCSTATEYLIGSEELPNVDDVLIRKQIVAPITEVKLQIDVAKVIFISLHAIWLDWIQSQEFVSLMVIDWIDERIVI